MKTTIKSILLSVFFTAAFAFIPQVHSLVGSWSLKESDGSVSHVDFTKNGLFNYVDANGKPLHHGKYKLNSDDIFSMNDNGCGTGYWAKYKLTFIGEDSVSFAVIDDTCSRRAQGVNGGGLKRVKK